MKTGGGDAFKMSVCPNIQDQSFRNGDGRQSANKRHVAMQSTKQIREPLEMFSMQYEKNPLKTAGGDAYLKKKLTKNQNQ